MPARRGLLKWLAQQQRRLTRLGTLPGVQAQVCRLRGRAPRRAELGASTQVSRFRGRLNISTGMQTQRCRREERSQVCTHGRAHSTQSHTSTPPRCERQTARRTETPNPSQRHVSPTHLLQELGQIVHLVVQNQPGTLAVVVLLDLFQGVVLDSLVRLLGHFGTRRASSRAHTSRVGRSGARASASWARDIPGAPAPRPEQGGPRRGGGGGTRPPMTGQDVCHSRGPPSADTVRQPQRAPAQRAGVDWLQKVPFRSTVVGARGGRSELGRAAGRGFPCVCAEGCRAGG